MPLAVEVATRGRVRCGSGAREYRRALLVALEGTRPLDTGPGPERPRCWAVPGSERAAVGGRAAPTATAAAAPSANGTPTKAAPTSASASPEKNSGYLSCRSASRRIARISARRRARLARFRSLHIEQISTGDLYYSYLNYSPNCYRVCVQVDSAHPRVMVPMSLGSSRRSISSACAVEISARSVFYQLQRTHSCSAYSMCRRHECGEKELR